MPDKNRESFLWRLKEDQQKINDWMDKQANISNSLRILVLHFIDKYGYQNVTDYEVQKALNLELIQNIETSAPQSSSIERNALKEKTVSKKPVKNEDDDIYGEVDINNL